MVLTLKQTEALDYLDDAQTTELLFGGAAGGGKSAIGCYWQLKRRFKYPGTRGLIGRAKLKTLKQTTLATFWEICAMQGITKKHFDYNSIQGEINFKNGSQILLKDLFFYPSDPNFDELGSLEITDAFIDEANQITQKARNIVKSRIRFQLNEHNLIPKMAMTCNPSKGYLYDEFYGPAKDGTLPDYRKFIQALPGDNPHISKYYIENLESLDEISRERLLHGNWEYDDDKAILMPYDKILDSFSNSFIEETEDRYITADIARKGSDKVVIGVWYGWVLKKIEVMEKVSTVETEDKINEVRIIHKVPLSNVIADEDGVGGGVIDHLNCMGFLNGSKPQANENYSNLKSQCWFRVADKINKSEVYIEDDRYKDQIIQDLAIMKQKDPDKDGKLAVIGKDKIKELIGRSSDFGDMIMMRAFWEQEQEFFVTSINI